MAQIQSTGAGIICWYFILIAERISSISLDPKVKLHSNCRNSERMYRFFFFSDGKYEATSCLELAFFLGGCLFD